MYEIYVHTNKINGKVYVGLTKNGMMARWRRHLIKARYYSKVKKNSYFQSALLKYGADVWDHVVLEAVTTLEEAEQAETKWTAHFKSNQREFGYNCTDGGNVSRGSLHPEVKRKISATVKLQMEDPVRRAAQSDAMKKHWQTHDNPFLGKQHTDESKAKMSMSLKGKFAGEKNPYYGKKHDEETRARMSDAAKKRTLDPKWVSPLIAYNQSEEGRRLKSERTKGIPNGKHTKEDVLAACEGCTTQQQVANKLGCTSANIYYLMRHFNIVDEVKGKLGIKVTTKDGLLELSKQCKTLQEMANKLGCTIQNVSYFVKKYNIKHDVIKNLRKRI